MIVADEANLHTFADALRFIGDHPGFLATKALEHPTFSYSYQIVDNRRGNGDGRIQKGEEITMYLTVRNTGKGRSYDAQANLHNLSGAGVLLRDGRFNDVSNMNPNDEKKVAFTFDVQPDISEPEVKLELNIDDQDLVPQLDLLEKFRKAIGNLSNALDRPDPAGWCVRVRSTLPEIFWFGIAYDLKQKLTAFGSVLIARDDLAGWPSPAFAVRTRRGLRPLDLEAVLLDPPVGILIGEACMVTDEIKHAAARTPLVIEPRALA